MQRAATLSFSHFPHTMEGPSYLLSQHVHKHARPCMQQRDPRASAPCKASQSRPNAPRDKAWRARFASCDTVKCKASGPLPKPTITAYGKLDKLVDPDLPGRGPWVSVGPKRGWAHAQGGVRVDGVAAHRPHMFSEKACARRLRQQSCRPSTRSATAATLSMAALLSASSPCARRGRSREGCSDAQTQLERTRAAACLAQTREASR